MASEHDIKAGSGETQHRDSPALPASSVAKVKRYKCLVFALTFISYATYSATRLPLSIAKSTLHPDDDSDEPGFAPFNNDNGGALLGVLDSTFLFAYTIGLFISGPLGDRLNLRAMLMFGMLGSAMFLSLFAMADVWHIHNFAYFMFCQIGFGLFQSSGWPANVTVLSRWFGHESRGLLMGFWNSHGSTGFMMGKIICTQILHAGGWMWAFQVMAMIMVGVALIVGFGLVNFPHDVLTEEEQTLIGASYKTIDVDENVDNDSDEQELLNVDAASDSKGDPFAVPVGSIQKDADADVDAMEEFEEITFKQALAVPGVIQYSMVLFFSKLVAYAFIFWLPFYLERKCDYSETFAGNISVVFDFGGVAGGIIAGYFSDRYKSRALVCFVMFMLCVPTLMAYAFTASTHIGVNVVGMFTVGLMVNGPYLLISSAVAADLGTHPSLKGNPKAMSTVTGIIDGTGSAGAALQGVFIGVVSDYLGWMSVFYFLTGFCLCAALLLKRAVQKDWRTCRNRRTLSESQERLLQDHGEGADALLEKEQGVIDEDDTISEYSPVTASSLSTATEVSTSPDTVIRQR